MSCRDGIHSISECWGEQTDSPSGLVEDCGGGVKVRCATRASGWRQRQRLGLSPWCAPDDRAAQRRQRDGMGRLDTARDHRDRDYRRRHHGPIPPNGELTLCSHPKEVHDRTAVGRICDRAQKLMARLHKKSGIKNAPADIARRTRIPVDVFALLFAKHHFYSPLPPRNPDSIRVWSG